MNPLDWLLEPDNPFVRYHALRQLLGCGDDDSDVRQARAAIPESPVVRRIWARQAPEGHWGDPSSPYLPKYKATYWTLMLLGFLGLSRDEEPIRRAVEHVLAFQGPEGGFRERGEEGARREYAYVARRARQRGKSPPPETDFIADLLHQSVLSCLTGNVVAALLRLGYGDDPRVWRAVNWLVDVQNADGGWLCPYWRAHVRDTHGCFYGTICSMEAFAEIPEERRTAAVRDAAARAAEFLLMHHLYKADHHDFAVIKPQWLTLAFPWFYGYNILRGLWVLVRLGYRDSRMEDALAVLQRKRTPDGVWVLENAPQGRIQADLEKKGQPSKWLTLMALWVQKGMADGS
ncbi:MAG: hypothetical protein H5T65_12035 [Chloroflexi bacterium]|nr:hypothetical protein [Chloroflexota bacterium]